MVEPLEEVPRDWPHRELSRSLKLGDLNWHVQIGGSGPTVLLLHGTGASAHSFAEVVEQLLPSCTVVVPDLPGHGFTTGARVTSLTLPHIAAQLDALLLAIGVSTVDAVVGHSSGVPLAMRWSIGQARAPGALIGFNPALVAPPAGYTSFVAPLVVPIATSSLMAGLVSAIVPATGLINRLLDSTRSEIPASQRLRYAKLFSRSEHVRGAMGLMAAADLPSLLQSSGELRSPLQFVLGAQDEWVPQYRLLPILAKYFETARVDTWEGGHLLHEANPLRAAKLIMSTLL